MKRCIVGMFLLGMIVVHSVGGWTGASALEINTSVTFPGTALTDSTINVNSAGTLTLNEVWTIANGQTFNLYGTLVAGASRTAIKNEGGSSNIYIDGGKVLVNQTTNYVSDVDNTFLYYSGDRINYTLGSNGVTFEVNNAGTVTRVSGTLKNATGATGNVTKTGNGTLQLSRGTYTGATTIKGGMIEILNVSTAGSYYTGGFSMQGGTLKNSTSANPYTLAVNGATAGTNVLLGNVKDSSNASINTALAVSGSSTVLSLGNATTPGNLTTTGYVLVSGGGTLNIVNGTNKINGSRPEAQADGIRVLNSKLNISGGTTTIKYPLRLENGTLEMTGGTVTVGTASTASTPYTFFVGGNGTGTAKITGGTIDSKGSIYVGWQGNNSSLTLDGGTVKAANAVNGLVFGNTAGNSMNFVSGTVAVNRLGNRPDDSSAGTINIYGKNMTWSNYDGTGNIAAVLLNTNLNTNLVVASNGFSTLEAGVIYFAGTANVSYAGGVGVFSEGYDLIRATTFTDADGTVNRSGLFTAAKAASGIELTGLAPANEVNATFSSDGVQFADANKGWFAMPHEASDLVLNIDLGTKDADDFLEWLNTETYYDHEASLTGNQLSLGSLTDLAAGESFFWDFSGFDSGVLLTGISGTIEMSVPEPSTWVMLLSGWALLLWYFGSRSQRIKEV